MNQQASEASLQASAHPGKTLSFVFTQDDPESHRIIAHNDDTKSDFVIYHYGTYERTKMKQMLEKYGIKDSFTDKMVDLNQVLKRSVVFPTHSFGLKEIAKELGFGWSE